MKPITPKEMIELKGKLIPDKIIEIFNELIAKNWNGKSSRVLQEDVIYKIIENTCLDRSDIFTNNYLDIEDVYREYGWDVCYDKAYMESSFTFTVSENKK